jgi:hypothetical protein
MKDPSPIRRLEVIAETGGTVDEVRFTLGIYGEDLKPAEITTMLGCAPTSAHRRGDLRRGGQEPWQQGAWTSVEGRGPTAPDDLIGLLFGRLPHGEAIWAQIRAKHSIRLSLGIFVVRWNSGFELSPTSLKNIANIGGPLGIDIYDELATENGGTPP